MRLSKYSSFVELDSSCLVVSLITKAVISLSNETRTFVQSIKCGDRYEDIPKKNQELWKLLSENLIIVPDDLDEWDLLKKIHKNQLENRKTLSLIITPTLDCNMGCFYCFEEHKEGELSATLDINVLSVLEKIIDTYTHLHVQWFGGEPLLAMQTIRRLTSKIFNFCEEKNISYSAEVITNGHLLSRDMAKELSELHVSDVQVTFEGDKKFHNKIRTPNKVSDSYDVLVENSITASEFLSVTCRVHVAPYNIESIFSLLEDLASKGLHEKCRKIYFAPLFDYKPHKMDIFFTSDNKKFLSSQDFALHQSRLAQKASTLGFNISDVLEVSFDICVAVQKDSLVIGPDGTTFKCYLDTSDSSESVGHIETGLQREKTTKWIDYDFSLDKECRACSFAPVCLGGCPKQHMKQIDKSVVCTPLKYNFSEMMKLQHSN